MVVILVGTKADVDNLYSSSVHFPSRCVSFSEGKDLADSYGIKFFETSARNGAQVQEVFETMTRDIMDGFKRREAQRKAMQSTVKMDSGSCLWDIFSFFRKSKAKRPSSSTKSGSVSVKSFRSSSLLNSERRDSFLKSQARN